MSCNCNSSTYSGSCCPEVPYPSISPESVPSLMDNLVYALYGTIEKSTSSGRVVWNIPCDPSTSPAEIAGIPRLTDEGLLCYFIRVLNDYAGETISATSTSATIASNTTTNGASIVLTPGNWVVGGSATFDFSGTTVTANSTIGSGVSLTSGTLVANQQQILMLPTITTATASPAFAISTPNATFNVTSNTTVYLVAKSPVTSAGTMTFSSSIKAVRVI